VPDDEHCNAIDHDGSDMPPRCARLKDHDGKHASVYLASWPKHWHHEWNDKETS